MSDFLFLLACAAVVVTAGVIIAASIAIALGLLPGVRLPTWRKGDNLVQVIRTDYSSSVNVFFQADCDSPTEFNPVSNIVHSVTRVVVSNHRAYGDHHITRRFKGGSASLGTGHSYHVEHDLAA